MSCGVTSISGRKSTGVCFSLAGFTLVELLVVIGIIALLISILLPALSKARRSANKAVCLSNLRQLAIGLQLYEQENHYFAPTEDDGYNPGGAWMVPVAHYLTNFINPYDPGTKYASVFPTNPTSFSQQASTLSYMPKAWFCPEAPSSSVLKVDSSQANTSPTGGGYGGTTVAWGPGTYHDINYISSSYGFNGWCYDTRYGPSNGTYNYSILFSNLSTLLPGVNPIPYFVNPAYAKNSSDTPCFGDCSWREAWPAQFGSATTTDTPPATSKAVLFGTQYNNQATVQASQGGSQMARFCMARHGRFVNIVFLDGHAQTVGLADLWKLRWSPQAVVGAPYTPVPSTP